MKKSSKKPIDPRTVIGHIHLKVSDLDRSITFYHEVLGFDISTRMGNGAVFLSAGGYHHHIGLNTWESKGGKMAPSGTTGLYHFAILVPSRKELARMLQRLIDHQWPIEGSADHGVSESIYLRDPDGNGIEIYADKPKHKWPKDTHGKLIMYTEHLDLKQLLLEIK